MSLVLRITLLLMLVSCSAQEHAAKKYDARQTLDKKAGTFDDLFKEIDN